MAACSSSPTIPITVSTAPIEKPSLILPQPDVMQWREVIWKGVTVDGVGMFSLDERGYENLSLNSSDSRSFMIQQKAIIDAYENYYNEENIK